jgi:hypothetical protein
MLARQMIWRDFELAAPELARRGRDRFERTGVVLVGTLRRDGSPRISPVEPYFVRGHLLLGMMSRSGKARDLLRDPRCSIHSSISDVNGSEGEFQVLGRAVLVDDDEVRRADDSAWWHQVPPEACRVFSIEIDRATLVDWDIGKGFMSVRSWATDSGVSEVSRPYP